MTYDLRKMSIKQQ